MHYIYIVKTGPNYQKRTIYVQNYDEDMFLSSSDSKFYPAGHPRYHRFKTRREAIQKLKSLFGDGLRKIERNPALLDSSDRFAVEDELWKKIVKS